MHVCPDPFSLFALEGAGYETNLGPLSVCPGEPQTLSADAAGPSVAHHKLCLFSLPTEPYLILFR